MWINIQQMSQFETYISSGKYDLRKLTVRWTLSGTIVKISTLTRIFTPLVI